MTFRTHWGSTKAIWKDHDAALRAGVPAQTPARARNTQNGHKKTSFVKKYYSSTKCNDRKLKALSSLAQYHNRFTRENKIGHPSFTLYIHLFSARALAHREGCMMQVWKIFSGETNHLASCSLANGVCNFLYLQQKKNKVTQNRPPQIFKRPNCWSVVLLVTYFAIQYEIYLAFQKLWTSTLENKAF